MGFDNEGNDITGKNLGFYRKTLNWTDNDDGIFEQNTTGQYIIKVNVRCWLTSQNHIIFRIEKWLPHLISVRGSKRKFLWELLFFVPRKAPISVFFSKPIIFRLLLPFLLWFKSEMDEFWWSIIQIFMWSLGFQYYFQFWWSLNSG